jgi:hypothetical protein
MREASAIISFLFCLTSLIAQEEEKLSLTIQNSSIQQAFEQIEQKTDYRFYFAEEWLDSIPINKTYHNLSVEEILDDLFTDTNINFFISWDDRIILTQNNSIFGTLPKGFLELQKPSPQETITETFPPVPILLAKNKDISDVVLETVRIGKESKIGKQALFTLSGYVINSRTGEPIPDLTLVVRAINKGVATDNSGFYELKVPAGLHLIETSAMGIEGTKRNVIIYDDGQLDFNLNENLEELDEVIVQADAIRNVEDASTGSTRIGSETSKHVPLVLGERDVLKIATTLPGITTAGEGSGGFNVRGGKTDQNLILLDNVVLYNPSHFFGFFQAINPFAINDLVVYKGSIPAEFGGRLSSVFEISS